MSELGGSWSAHPSDLTRKPHHPLTALVLSKQEGPLFLGRVAADSTIFTERTQFHLSTATLNSRRSKHFRAPRAGAPGLWYICTLAS